ncbi:unnamed protein product [Rhizoctonia solani]|uniref:Uncharacterized protein n=1 Tax=Rhizoctonia solani TaxID=456999 RepID=A0A8H2X3V6_9AGAM|nr:unnamed protein product [Rhizoctonia solani]
MPGDNALPFFAVEYDGRRVSIRRTVDYDQMIESVCKVFPALSKVSKGGLSFSQVFPELGEGAVEITCEMWKEAVPLVKTMRVVVTKVEAEQPVPEKKQLEHNDHEVTQGPRSINSSEHPPNTGARSTVSARLQGKISKSAPAPRSSINTRRGSGGSPFQGLGVTSLHEPRVIELVNNQPQGPPAV